MKRYRWWLGSLLVAAFTLAPALAALADPGDPPKKKKRDRARKDKGGRDRGKRGRKAGMLGQIVKVCNITDEKQKQDLEAACGKYEEARKAAAEESAGLRKEMMEAKKAKDRDKMKDLGAKMKEIRKEADEAQAAVMGILSPEQRATWEGRRMAAMVMGRLKKAELDDAQEAKIMGLCKAQALELKDADEKSKRSAMGALLKDILAGDILTAEQKAKVPPPRERKGKGDRPKKGPGERKGKRKKKEE